MMGECIAVKELGKGKYIVVIYREVSKDEGVIILPF